MNLLLLGGASEAVQLGRILSARGVKSTISLAGRVKDPAAQPLPMRVGGFGGIDGLTAWLKDHAISHVIDATHPFAAEMSTNAVAACERAGIPLLALTRAPWVAGEGDRWITVPDIDAAAAALKGPAQRVFLAVGRMNLAAFACQPQHDYLLRLIDPPGALPLPRAKAIIARGPFDLEGDLALMRAHRIEVVISKNAGGTGARAKIDAARALGLPVIMIDRPAIPRRAETHNIEDALAWLHGAAERGV